MMRVRIAHGVRRTTITTWKDHAVKRTDLNIGAELYHATPNDWNDNRIPRSARVQVLAVEPYARERFGSAKPYQAPGGNGVHVVVLDANGATDYTDVVQLAHLRGPYAETLKVVEAHQQADRARRDRQDAAREAFDDYRGAAVQRAKAAGLSSAMPAPNLSATTNTIHARVSVTADDLNLLLGRLAALENYQRAAEAMLNSLHTVDNPKD